MTLAASTRIQRAIIHIGHMGAVPPADLIPAVADNYGITTNEASRLVSQYHRPLVARWRA